MGKAFTFLAAVLFTLLPWGGEAALRIDITKGGLDPMPIAVPQFVELDTGGAPVSPSGMGQKIADVVAADLERSGLFRPLNRDGFLQDSLSLFQKGPEFKDWRLVGADAVVRAAVRESGDKIMVDFYLHDVFQGNEVGQGKRYMTPPKDWRYLAHRVADEVYSRLTGESGYFASRISFVASQGRRKWLAMMDQDGANRMDLTRGEALVLTPRFSPEGDNLFYVSYETGDPRINRFGIYNATKTRLSDYPGLNSTPSWSPDGSRIALTLSKDGNPEIYLKNLSSGTLSRLTNNTAIDTSPTWSPDGRFLAFNSDRGGSPQIYVMDTQGGAVRRISNEGKYNAAPAWSPRGDLIAYVKGVSGGFQIAVINPQTGSSRSLSNSWMDESPVWSPNGRVVLFSRQNGDSTRLYTIDLTGYNERVVPIEGGVSGSDPSWSPLIR